MKKIEKLIKLGLIFIGTLSVAIGIIGIFLPLLPTTPLLLLGAGCYIRSSEKFYNKLIYNKYLGSYIRSYLDGKGVPIRIKVRAIALLWITIGASALFFVSIPWIKLMLFIIASGVTIHILSLKTRKENNDIY